MTDSVPGRTRCRGEPATRELGTLLAGALAPGDLVALEGDLGAGKTVFVRGLAAGLGLESDDVCSPSFVLAIEHRGGRLPLLHVDLYRLPDGASLEDTGIDEALADGWIVAVEWAERMPPELIAQAWRVSFAPGEDEREREVVIERPARRDDAAARQR